MSIEQFAKFIIEQRKERGLTQSDLAKKLNLTDKAVSKWERRLNYPDISTIEELAKVFDVTVPELLRGEKKMDQDFKEKESIDKAVKETLDFSKQLMKNQKRNYLNQGLILIIVFLVMLVGVQGYNQLFGEFGTSVKELKQNIASLQTELDAINESQNCSSSLMTTGIYYAQKGYSWQLYSIEFLTCRIMRVVTYDDLGNLWWKHYYSIKMISPLKYVITVGISTSDSVGPNAFSELKYNWYNTDFLKELEFADNYEIVYFGHAPTINNDRQYAKLNDIDENYWPFRIK